MALRLLLLLGALSAFGPLAIDFYLPSFPALAASFAVPVEQVQLSLSAYFIGIALGQLVYGPLADLYGRRLPLLIGVCLFTVASLGCALAPNLDWLIAARFVQALGGCAGMVVSRAVVRDLCDPINTARVFSQLMLVMGVAPILAPLAGSLLLESWGWQSIFVVLAIFSAICWLAVWRVLPETLPDDQPPAPLSGAWRQYWRLIKDPNFIGYAMAGGFAMAGMFAYISGSPFVLIELHGLSASTYGWVFGSNALGFIVMAQVNAQLVRRFGPVRLLPKMLWAYALLACTLVLLSSMWPDVLLSLLLPLFLCLTFLGSVIPNASACAMSGQGSFAGSASALLGFTQFSIAAVAAWLVSHLHDGSALPMTVSVASCALLALASALLTRRFTRG